MIIFFFFCNHTCFYLDLFAIMIQSSEGQKHPQPQTSTSNLDAHPLTNAEVPDRSSAAEPHHLKPPISSTSPSNSHVSETAPSSQNRHSELESSSGRIDSWSTLSFFGRQDRALESTILQAIGMEKLTRLGRVTSARVTVECLQLDPSAMENLPLMQKKKMASKIPQPAVPSSRYASSGYRVLDIVKSIINTKIRCWYVRPLRKGGAPEILIFAAPTSELRVHKVTYSQAPRGWTWFYISYVFLTPTEKS